jgi:hypothetical protein
MQQSLQPIFHLFNSFLPSVATYMVISAIVSSLPQLSGQKGKGQLNEARFNGMKLQRVVSNRAMNSAPIRTKAYTIPTSMRTRTTRNY